MDHLPLEAPPRPRPHLRTLTLLVGRMTTIKLAYWAALTVYEWFGPREGSLAFAGAATLGAMAWAATAARRLDPVAGRIGRSAAAIGTAFATASVVAAPASLPLLLIERQHSIAGCAAQASCHGEALVFWAVTFGIGFLLIPLVFALALRGADAP